MDHGGGVFATVEDRRREISELFHAINQPLTTLCCSLELSLYQNWTAEQYREAITQALEQAERLSGLLAGARQLWEAEDPGELRQVIWLDTAIAETVQDLLPLAHERQVAVSCCCGSRLPVLAEPRRMHQGLFYVVESALNRAQNGTEFRVTADLHEGTAVLGLTIAPGEQGIPDERSGSNSATPTEETEGRIDLPLMVARRIFEAAGGVIRYYGTGIISLFACVFRSARKTPLATALATGQEAIPKWTSLHGEQSFPISNAIAELGRICLL